MLALLGEDSAKEQWLLPALLSRKQLFLSSYCHARHFNSSLHVFGAFQAAALTLELRANESYVHLALYEEHLVLQQILVSLSHIPCCTIILYYIFSTNMIYMQLLFSYNSEHKGLKPKCIPGMCTNFICMKIRFSHWDFKVEKFQSPLKIKP